MKRLIIDSLLLNIIYLGILSMNKLSPVEVGVVGSLDIQTHRTEPRY